MGLCLLRSHLSAVCQSARSRSESSGKALQCCEWWRCSVTKGLVTVPPWGPLVSPPSPGWWGCGMQVPAPQACWASLQCRAEPQAGPATQPGAASATHWSCCHLSPDCWQWESPNARCRDSSPLLLLVPLKAYCEVPGGIGCSSRSSFATRRWDVAICGGPKLGSTGPSLDPVPQPSSQTFRSQSGAETLPSTWQAGTCNSCD